MTAQGFCRRRTSETTRNVCMFGRFFSQRRSEMIGTILIVILVLMLLGTFPTWPHSRSWGYGPSGGLGLIVVILLILLLMGYLRF